MYRYILFRLFRNSEAILQLEEYTVKFKDTKKIHCAT